MEREVYERMAAIEDEHWWFTARRRILRSVLRSLPLPPDPKILEAGCGTGGNLPMLADFGQVSAFEPDAGAREHIRTKGNFDVRNGRLPHKVPFDPESFDLVVVLDVIEHVYDDQKCIETLQRYVKPGGWGLFTVPAYRFLWSHHDELHHHRRRYSRVVFAKVLKLSGFIPVYTTYFNTFLFPAIAAIRIAKKTFSLCSRDDQAIPSRLVNELLGNLFASERHLLPRLVLPFGVSVLAVVCKAER